MPRGDKSSYTDKQKRQAEHIEYGYEARSVSEKEAARRAWATVNRQGHGGKKTGSGRTIEETSTNVVLAGTFNVAMFPLEQIKQGIQRRFMFNVAEKLARTIEWPDYGGT